MKIIFNAFIIAIITVMGFHDLVAQPFEEPERMPVPYVENFDGPWSGGAPSNYPNIWTKQFISGMTNWVQYNGCLDGQPYTSPAGGYNALFYKTDWSEPETRLITPALDFGNYTENTKLSFWHCQREWSLDQDSLSVYYRIPVWNELTETYTGTWIELIKYGDDIPDWTYAEIDLPSPTNRYQICFKGFAYYGYGVGIDQVEVTGSLKAPENVVSTSDSTDVLISWDAVNGAVSYKVYGSADPYGTFSEVSGDGTFDGTSWSYPNTDPKKFFYVVADDGLKGSGKSEIVEVQEIK